MNSLSWFLYLADVVSSMQMLFTLIGLFGLVGGTISSIAAYMESSIKWPAVIPIISLFMLFAAALLPSKSTMYAIAASELGEQAAKSELGQKGIKAIEAWIDEQLKGKK